MSLLAQENAQAVAQGENKIDEKERNESCFGYENCTCDNEGVCSGYND